MAGCGEKLQRDARYQIHNSMPGHLLRLVYTVSIGHPKVWIDTLNFLLFI